MLPVALVLNESLLGETGLHSTVSQQKGLETEEHLSEACRHGQSGGGTVVRNWKGI